MTNPEARLKKEERVLEALESVLLSLLASSDMMEREAAASERGREEEFL